jgi:hypothetical protein
MFNICFLFSLLVSGLVFKFIYKNLIRIPSRYTDYAIPANSQFIVNEV